MNNSVIGETMENLRNRVDTDKISEKRRGGQNKKAGCQPSVARHNIFTNDLVGIGMHKSKLFLKNPVYTGITILENSKLLICGFYYNVLKKQYGSQCELLYT